MNTALFTKRLILVSILILLIPAAVLAQGTLADYERADQLRSLTQGKTFKMRISPNWFDGDTKFWYRNNLAGDTKEFILVDAEQGTRRPAFNHRRLARTLSRAAGETYTADKLPFDDIQFVEDDDAIKFVAEDTNWKCNLENYECTRLETTERIVETGARAAQRGQRGTGQRGAPQRGARGAQPAPEANLSPDGNWEIFTKNFNLYLRSTQSEVEFQLTFDGAEVHYYSPNAVWSPDSKKLVTHKTRPGQERLVHYVESSPRDQLQPKHSTRVYAKPGDVLTINKPALFDVETKNQIPISDDLFPNPYSRPRYRWFPDSRSFTFEYNHRGHTLYRVIEVNADTGRVHALIDEDPETFFDYNHKKYINFLDESNEIIWASERDGWNQLYLYNSRNGRVKNQITKGDWVMRGVDRVDEENRQIWFRAGGLDPDQDPYLIHYCRINFDGSGFVDLTPGDGNHTIQYSPDNEYFIDTYSRIDMPPVHELRRTADGELVCELETADISDLLDTGWIMPEVFTAKARDGETDIWGIICRPTNYDQSKDYPVIEYIYAGPHSSHVPKSFREYNSMQALAELGFILIQCDGLGTSNRSKAFHDVCWKNLGDAGFPDRILWITAAAQKYPYMDISRVGIYGTSAGGQNSTGAVLFHPEFYKVAVSNCGCHDNRMDKIWWNELWMSYPIGPHYAASSNVDNAYRLQGKLFLIVGEMDSNVDPSSTMQVVDALIKANKDFDLLFVPGGGHGAGGSFGERRKRDFFVRHLLGVEPPNWNKIN